MTIVKYKDPNTGAWVAVTDSTPPMNAEDVRDIVAGFIKAGANVTVDHNDPANTFTINSTSTADGGITDEQAIAAVAGAMRAGNNIDITYNAGALTITVDVEPLDTGDIGGLGAALSGKADAVDTANALAGKQPLDSDLTTIAALSPGADNVLQGLGGAWAARSPAQLKATLGLTKSDVGLSNVDNTADVDKPVPNAVTNALALKYDKTGGAISGAVTMASTLSVTGAVTAASFTGIGSGLTQLNATQLQSGTIPVARFPTVIPSDTTGTAAAWTTARLLSFTGAATGSGSVKGNADVSIALTIPPDSINLGTQTVGNYVSSVVGTTNRILATLGGSPEGGVYTLSAPQDIHTAATPTFSRLTLAVAQGTAPLIINSSTKVVNLNADLLDGLDSTYFLNASNFTGVLPSASLVGPYTGISRVGTLDQFNVLGASTFTGTTAFSQTPTVAGSLMWHAGNDGAGSLLDAGYLEGHRASYFASDDELEALMGDLFAVGLYDAEKYNGTAATMPHPVWDLGPNVYWHNIYWIVASPAEVDFIDADYSGRYDVGNEDAIDVANGDWIIAIDPQFGAPGHEVGTNQPLSQMVFQYIPFSSETYVKAKIAEHTGDDLDPHAAAGYLKTSVANTVYSPLVHIHEAEITSYIAQHELKPDPHPGYLTETEADVLYLKPGVVLPYEPQGAVLEHELKPDPHAQYVSHGEGNATYSPIGHPHVEYSLNGHTHVATDEVLSTDGAQSSRLFIGDDPPVNPLVGDLWVQTFDIALQPPSAPAGLTYTVTPTSITLNWFAWDPSVGQTGVEVERSPNGSSGWLQILSDVAAPFDLTYTDPGRSERTAYWYRVRAKNITGNGVWGTVNPTTTNAAPAAPTGLNVSSVTPTSFRLGWAAASSPANDPLHATPYEVFRNGTSLGHTASLFWDHTGLSENVTYNLGVRVRDNLGVYSAVTALNGTAGNAAPPAPTGQNVYYSSPTELHMGWNAVTGITDFQTYQVFVNGNYVANTTSTAFGFSGLAYSTGYTLGVRTVDWSNAVSAIVTASGTTQANPDTTPPAPLSIYQYQPEANYGRMVVRWNQPEASFVRVYYNVNGAGWNVKYEGNLPAANGQHAVDLGTWGAGTTIYCVIHQWDNNNNVRYGDQVAYTLVESPINFGPQSSNSWRPTQGGQWGAAGNAKLYQGFWDTPSLSSYGYWFYGSQFSDWWREGRTITAAQIFINREGCGYNQQDMVGLYVHDLMYNPGNVTNYGTPGIYGGHDAGTVQYNDSKWMGIPVEWMYEVVRGQRRGFAVARLATGRPYLCLRPAGEGYSGAVAIHHLG